MCMILDCPWATQPHFRPLSLDSGLSRLAWLSLVTTRSLLIIHTFMHLLIHSTT